MFSRKNLVSLFLLLAVSLAFSSELTVKYQNYSARIEYDSTSYPGQAFFVKMSITPAEKQNLKVEASAELFGEKRIAKADFYFIKNDGQNDFQLLTGLPMWSWEKANPTAKIIIKCSVNGQQNLIELPVSIEPKKYPHERIQLNESLSDLVSTPSPEKKEQSRVLNELLQTVNKDAVYEVTGFIRPTDKTRITSEFGQTRTFIYNNGKESPSYHAGLDFGIPTGSEVFACGAGKVVMARWRIVTGYSVIIEHLPGLYSIYYHLSELKCKEGDIVKKGDLVALSGATGLATGPHLHWEIRMNTICLDPDSLVKNFSFSKSE
ncbi:MAG: M23 family metallopeptidase [Treponema sp.]